MAATHLLVSVQTSFYRESQTDRLKVRAEALCLKRGTEDLESVQTDKDMGDSTSAMDYEIAFDGLLRKLSQELSTFCDTRYFCNFVYQSQYGLLRTVTPPYMPRAPQAFRPVNTDPKTVEAEKQTPSAGNELLIVNCSEGLTLSGSRLFHVYALIRVNGTTPFVHKQIVEAQAPLENSDYAFSVLLHRMGELLRGKYWITDDQFNRFVSKDPKSGWLRLVKRPLPAVAHVHTSHTELTVIPKFVEKKPCTTAQELAGVQNFLKGRSVEVVLHYIDHHLEEMGLTIKKGYDLEKAVKHHHQACAYITLLEQHFFGQPAYVWEHDLEKRVQALKRKCAILEKNDAQVPADTPQSKG